MIDLTVAEIRQQLQDADARAFAVLERSLVADSRKGVRLAVEKARKRLESEQREAERLESLYAFDEKLAAEHGAQVVLGLDEVGRGPLAGPLAVGGVVLRSDDRIEGLNDSKQLKHDVREVVAAAIRERALAWTVQYVDPRRIDEQGMSASLRQAFGAAIAEIESQGVSVDLVLLDGNALRLDPREVNVVKGDARSASIAAASIVAKVARDALMVDLDAVHPGYGFASNKGYASADHIEAIKTMGISDVHRSSFCTAFTQPTLF